MSDIEQGNQTPEGNDWDPHLGSLLGGILAGAVMLGAVWLLVGSFSGGLHKTTSPNAAEPTPALGDQPSSTSSQSTEQTGDTGPTRLARCKDAATGVDRPLRLAAPAMDQWEVHIGAMNKLVVGSITLQQANAFWNQTRVGAYHAIGQFKDADAQLEQQGVDCPAPRLLGSGASSLLKACAQHVAAELRALNSADVAISTWNNHMHSMDQLRDGKLSPTAATQMWLAMWQHGVHELTDYRDAASAVKQGGSCNNTGGTTPPSAPPTGGSSPSPPMPTSSESSMSGMNMG